MSCYPRLLCVLVCCIDICSRTEPSHGRTLPCLRCRHGRWGCSLKFAIMAVPSFELTTSSTLLGSQQPYRPHIAACSSILCFNFESPLTGSIRPDGRAPPASQPLRAPSSDSLHRQLSRILLSTPCTLAVALPQASHHRRGHAITGRRRIVGAHTCNSPQAFSGQTITSRVSMGSASSSLAIWFASFSLWLTGTYSPSQVKDHHRGGSLG